MYLRAWCIAIFFGKNSNSLLQFEKALAQPLLKKLKVQINWWVYDGKNIPQVKLNFQHERDQKIEPLDDTIPQVVQPPVLFCIICIIFTKSLLRSICCNQSYCQAGPPMNQFWASKGFTAKSWSLFIANSFFFWSPFFHKFTILIFTTIYTLVSQEVGSSSSWGQKSRE